MLNHATLLRVTFWLCNIIGVLYEFHGEMFSPTAFCWYLLSLFSFELQEGKGLLSGKLDYVSAEENN